MTGHRSERNTWQVATPDPRIAILERMYGALSGSLPVEDGVHDELFDELCHPDLLLDFTRRTFDGDLGLGRQGFRELATIQAEVWESQTIYPEEYVVSGDEIVVAVALTMVGRSEQAQVQARAAHSRLFRDGKIARWRVYQSKEDALADLGRE